MAWSNSSSKVAQMGIDGLHLRWLTYCPMCEYLCDAFIFSYFKVLKLPLQNVTVCHWVPDSCCCQVRRPSWELHALLTNATPHRTRWVYDFNTCAVHFPSMQNLSSFWWLPLHSILSVTKATSTSGWRVNGGCPPFWSGIKSLQSGAVLFIDDRIASRARDFLSIGANDKVVAMVLMAPEESLETDV